MDTISHLLQNLFDLVTLGIIGAVIGIFLLSIGIFVEKKATRKFGRSTMAFGFIVLAVVAFDYFN